MVGVLQPSAIQKAGDYCSGTQPFERFLTEHGPETSSPEESDPAIPELFAEYFDGVVRVEDGGRTLVVQTQPSDDDPLGMSVLAAECVFEQLEAPSYVTELVRSTRALDGRQTDAWGAFSATWGYHPDSGLNLIISTR